MTDYRAIEPATKPPSLPLSAQMVVFAEMAAPEIRGVAHMVGTDWQAEALRLEGAVDALRELSESAEMFLPIKRISEDAERFRLAMVAARDLIGGQ